MEAIDYSNKEEPKEDIVAMLLSGKRPEGMGFEEYRVKRAAVQTFLRRRKRGRFIYISKELGTETIEGEKKEVIKSYGPYVKNK